jgi:hypothetical protein
VALGILWAWKALEYGQGGEIAEELQRFHVLRRPPFLVGKPKSHQSFASKAKNWWLFDFEKAL